MTPKKSSFVAVLAELAVNMKKLPPLLFLYLCLIVSANAFDNDSKNEIASFALIRNSSCISPYEKSKTISTKTCPRPS